MFGKPEWFKPKRFGWGLTPVTWQGWCYTLAWIAAMMLPVLFFAARGQTIEIFIWLIASVGMLCWDVKQIMLQMPQPAKASLGEETTKCAKIWHKFCNRKKNHDLSNNEIDDKS